ncbi:methyltransferase [Callinectes sapidus nudivirus]|nr:methyltransferase [Callinectes sapidus nudivirus]
MYCIYFTLPLGIVAFGTMHRTKPYSRPSRNDVYISKDQLLACGHSTKNNNMTVSYKYNIKTNSNETIPKSAIYKLEPPKINESELVLQYSPSTMEYSQKTVKNYSSVKGLIQKNDKLKNSLSENVEIFKKNRKLIDLFPTIVSRKHVLENRGSLKLSNINYEYENIIGKKIRNNASFADLCCAPGGFSFYIISSHPQCKMNAYLFTMPPKDTYLPISENLKNLESNTTISLFYGDITDQQDREHFKSRIERGLVDFVLADGGIDFSGNENIQEFLSMPLYESQTLLGIQILKDGGFMICKFFDMYTTFSITLLYILSSMFETVSICKPISSKAGNAEKYVIFDKFKRNDSIIKHLERATEKKAQYMVNSFVSESANFDAFSNDVTAINKNFGLQQFATLQQYNGRIPIKKSANKEDFYFAVWQTTFKN